jgi:SNF2 family DNA or RNA helicase
MGYKVNNGLIEFENTPLEPKILFQQGKISAEMDGSETSLIVSKRPAEIKFEFILEPNHSFILYFQDTQLNEQQILSLMQSGYFIAEKKRIHFVSDKIKEYVASAFGNGNLSLLLKLLRQLYRDRLIDSVPSELAQKLNEKKSQKSQYDKLFVRELYPYQKEGVAWLKFCVEHGVGTILADDMGLGKTAQVIALCCEVLEKNPASKILIVIPNPLIANWLREFKFFAPSLTPYLHYGASRRGISSALSANEIIITPYTVLTSDISIFEEISFDLVLYDEASMLKNPHSGRSIAARRVTTNASVAMSGTPVENSLLDAWALCDLVFPGFLGSEKDFKTQYVHSKLAETLATDLSDLESSLRQITLRRMKKDVLTQLPEKLDIHTAVSMGVKEREGYDLIISEMQLEAENGGGEILRLINRLQQFTAHPVLLDTSVTHDTKSLISRSAKFELLILKLDEIANAKEKVIIFATFHKVIDLIQGAIKDIYSVCPGIIDGRTQNDERQLLIDKFSSSAGFDVLILHPKTAGMGLNITAATNVIHYCRQWNPALEAQATARAWRNGQQSTVSVYYLFYAETIEEMIDERIRLKQELSEQVVSVADYKETDKQLMLEYLESL